MEALFAIDAITEFPMQTEGREFMRENRYKIIVNKIHAGMNDGWCLEQ